MKGLFLTVVISLMSTSVGKSQSMAITIDDVPGRSRHGNCDSRATLDMNERLLDALEQEDAPATGFVTETSVCSALRDSLVEATLSMWLERGWIHRWAMSDGMSLQEEPREPGWLGDPARFCRDGS